ncbi:GNAT family N-acetyltransferase [Streptomyces microflavus]|uniref:GNAT family N-acetyltransferase n=1 Tax=Streptomyces microflavus TaxID=1919 RepID=UPI003814D7F6
MDWYMILHHQGLVLSEMNSIPGSRLWDSDRLHKFINDSNNHSQVALSHENEICGLAIAYGPVSLNPYLFSEDCVLLSRLIVREGWHGLGIGRSLLEKLWDSAAPLPIRWQLTDKNMRMRHWLASLALS